MQQQLPDQPPVTRVRFQRNVPSPGFKMSGLNQSPLRSREERVAFLQQQLNGDGTKTVSPALAIHRYALRQMPALQNTVCQLREPKQMIAQVYQAYVSYALNGYQLYVTDIQGQRIHPQRQEDLIFSRGLVQQYSGGTADVMMAQVRRRAHQIKVPFGRWLRGQRSVLGSVLLDYATEQARLIDLHALTLKMINADRLRLQTSRGVSQDTEALRRCVASLQQEILRLNRINEQQAEEFKQLREDFEMSQRSLKIVSEQQTAVIPHPRPLPSSEQTTHSERERVQTVRGSGEDQTSPSHNRLPTPLSQSSSVRFSYGGAPRNTDSEQQIDQEAPMQRGPLGHPQHD